MVVLAVLAVLLTVGAPSFVTLIRDNRLVSEVYALRGFMSTVRSEAMARRTPVFVCPSADGASCGADWSEGYLAFVDANADGGFDVGDGDALVLAEVVERDQLDVAFLDAGGAASALLRFDAQGTALPASSGTFVVCDERGDAFARALIVSLSGGLRAADDADGSGVVDGLGGADVSCP
jgi:type IV fimbrial biogenesis protein FimT